MGGEKRENCFLLFIDARINSEVYMPLLSTQICSNASKLINQHLTGQRDNDPKHLTEQRDNDNNQAFYLVKTKPQEQAGTEDSCSTTSAEFGNSYIPLRLKLFMWTPDSRL